MKFWKVIRVITGSCFTIIGVLLFIFLRELNDPEIEGETGRIGLDSYFISLFLIIIGVVILVIPINNKNPS